MRTIRRSPRWSCRFFAEAFQEMLSRDYGRPHPRIPLRCTVRGLFAVSMFDITVVCICILKVSIYS